MTGAVSFVVKIFTEASASVASMVYSYGPGCIPKLVSLFTLQADSQNRVVACVIMRCACRYIATPVLLDA